MLGTSFRLLSAAQIYPSPKPRKQLLGALCTLGALLAVAGCGGGGKESAREPALRQVRGAGFAFAAPAGWKVTRTPRSVAAAGSGADLVSVTTFRLVRRYRPALWPRVVTELDGVAARLARDLGGSVAGKRTVRVAGRQARRYDIAYEHAGAPLHQRIVFVLDGRREYQVLCRWEQPSAACADFVGSFRLT